MFGCIQVSNLLSPLKWCFNINYIHTAYIHCIWYFETWNTLLTYYILWKRRLGNCGRRMKRSCSWELEVTCSSITSIFVEKAAINLIGISFHTLWKFPHKFGNGQNKCFCNWLLSWQNLFPTLHVFLFLSLINSGTV